MTKHKSKVKNKIFDLIKTFVPENKYRKIVYSK